MSSSLSEEQKRKIEANRQKALARRAEKKQLIPMKAAGPEQNFQTQVFSQFKSSATDNLSQGHINGKSAEQNSTSEWLESINSLQGKSNDAVSDFYMKSGQPCNNGVNSYTNSQFSANKSVFVTDNKVAGTQLAQSSCQSSSNQQTSGSSEQFFKKGAFGKTVKGTCVLIAKDRFEVNIGYFASLIEVFKSIKSKLYGKTDG